MSLTHFDQLEISRGKKGWRQNDTTALEFADHRQFSQPAATLEMYSKSSVSCNQHGWEERRQQKQMGLRNFDNCTTKQYTCSPLIRPLTRLEWRISQCANTSGGQCWCVKSWTSWTSCWIIFLWFKDQQKQTVAVGEFITPPFHASLTCRIRFFWKSPDHFSFTLLLLVISLPLLWLQSCSGRS